jgi:hypothetical protein
MKKQNILVISVTMLILAAGLLFAGKTVDFTATWVLDESKLENTEGPSMAAQKLVIKQEANALAVDRFMSNPMMGDITMTEKMTLDGIKTESDTDFGHRTTIATWSEDGKVLTINSTILMNWDGNEMEMKIKEVWSLENDGAVLKLVSTFPTPDGDQVSTVFYNKSK